MALAFRGRLAQLDYCVTEAALQAHKTFSMLRWVAGGLAFVSALLMSHRLGAGLQWSRLIFPVTGIIISAFAALQAQRYKGLLEFQDYRCVLLCFYISCPYPFHNYNFSSKYLSGTSDLGTSKFWRQRLIIRMRSL